MVINNLQLIMKTFNTNRKITAKAKDLLINDLTNYPFTKNFYELHELKNLKRRKIVEALSRSIDRYKMKNIPNLDVLEKIFKDNFLFAEIVVKTPEAVGHDNVKT